jgi:2TM domain-containing protein
MPNIDIADEVLATSAEGLREQAVRRLKKHRDLHTHAFAYATINLMLWGVWTIIGVTSHSWFPWPLWVTLGWGIGLAFNAWDVYFRRPITEAEVRRRIDRLQHH